MSTTQPFSLRVTTPSLMSLLQLLQRGVEIRGLVQRVQFGFIGENQIDRALAHQIEEFIAVAIHAECIRQRQRDLPAGVMRDGRRLHEGFLRALGIPEIAFKIKYRGGRNLRLRRYQPGVNSCAAPR